LVKHAKLFRTIGARGVSSDESDDGATERNSALTFNRVSPAWRSDQLAALNWRVDEVVRRDRAPTIGKRKKPGNRMRIRMHTTKVNPRAAVPPGLPRNCYKKVWLDGLLPSQLKKLRVQDFDYDLNI
ncbi:hypothetical protein BV22DRAFT_987078, partial [Leucogyrophana mollusca]